MCALPRSGDAALALQDLSPPSLARWSLREPRDKVQRWANVWKDVSESVDALNNLYGHSKYLGRLSSLQWAAQSVVLRRLTVLAARRRPKSLLQPSAGAYQRLGTQLGYAGDGTTVVPYDASLVSLRGGQTSPVLWISVAPTKNEGVNAP